MRSIKFHRWIVLALALAAMAFAVSGCSKSGGSGNGNGSNGGGPGKTTTLTLWWNIPEGSNDNPVFAGWHRMIQTYMKEHPNIRIQTQSLPYDQLKQKLTNALVAGNPPDIVSGLNSWISDFYEMGALPNLTPDIKNWSGYKAMYSAVWPALTVDHKIVAFPLYIGIRASLYHADLLKKAGLSKPPTTWNEFFADLPKIKSTGVEHAYGIATDPARGPQELAVYLWGNKVSLVVSTGHHKFMNNWQTDPEQLKRATQVFAFYKKLLTSGAISRSEASWKWKDLDQNLVQGSVFMAPDGNWLEQQQEGDSTAPKDLEIAGVPLYNTQPVTFLEVAPAMTFKKSPHEKAAIAFLKWVDSKQAQMMFAHNRSPRTDVVQPGEWGKGFSDLARDGRSWPPVPLGGITNAMSQAIQQVLIGGMSPRDTAIWLSEQINSSLASNGLLAKKN